MAYATAWLLAAIPTMALWAGFRIPVTLLILLPCYGAPTLAPVGLTPTERASLRWTHELAILFTNSVAPPCEPAVLSRVLALPATL